MCTPAYWPPHAPPTRELSLARFYGSLQNPQQPGNNAVSMTSPLPSRPMSSTFPISTGPAAHSIAFGMQQESHPHPHHSRYPPPPQSSGHHLEAMLQKTNLHSDLSLMETHQRMSNTLPWQRVEERFGAMNKVHREKDCGDVEEGTSAHKSTENKPGHLDDNNRLLSHCRILKIKDANGRVREKVLPKALDLDRPKRARTNFSQHQLSRLETEFQRNHYMVGQDRARLANSLNLSEAQVKIWFQNRRTKLKRERSKEVEFQAHNSESIAACNILKILQGQRGQEQPVGMPFFANL